MRPEFLLQRWLSCCLGLLLSGGGLLAQDSDDGVGGVVVESHRWGFDGKVQEEEFNLLTLVIRNHTDRVYDGGVTLSVGGGLLSQDIRLPRPCFLGPGQSRRVQFAVYVDSVHGGFHVEVSRGRGLHIDRLQLGRPAVVVLRAADSPAPESPALPVFIETEFPMHLSYTSGLAAVVLDHQPQWTRPQRRAFVDWLHAGGRVHLYHGRSGAVEFRDELEVLNRPGARYRVGLGEVVRNGERLATARLGQLADRRGARALRYDSGESHVAEILQALRALVVPDHNWPLIYLVLILFFIAAVPVHGALSIRRLDYGKSALALVLIVACCTWAVYVLGARGYGEYAAVHCINYARALGPDRYDVLGFKNVFVTSGGRYTLKHDSEGAVYSTGQSEAVTAVQLPDTSIRLAIPVFSSRPLLHRGVINAPSIRVEVEQWIDPVLNYRDSAGLVLKSSVAPVAAWAFHQDKVVQMQVDGRDLSSGRVVGARKLLGQGVDGASSWSLWGGRPEHRSLAPVIEDLALGVLANRWRGRGGRNWSKITDDKTIRLALLCRSPKQFGLLGDVFGDEDSFVLYDLLVARPDE